MSLIQALLYQQDGQIGDVNEVTLMRIVLNSGRLHLLNSREDPASRARVGLDQMPGLVE